jgi:signal transduction histidine kinase
MAGLLVRWLVVLTIRLRCRDLIGSGSVRGPPPDVHLEDDPGVVPAADAPSRMLRYLRPVPWVERQLERLRAIDPRVVDGLLALVFFAIGVSTVYSQDLTAGLSEPSALALLTIAAATAPVVVRRSQPLLALTIGCAAVLVHIISDWPEGAVPMAVLLLTYSVAAWDTPRRASIGLGVVYATLVILGVSDTPGLDTFGVVGNMATFTVAWTIGVALRARRQALEARVRAAEERANVERQSAARALAEERLRIAQELHDVVAHSMSVIAVQAGVGAHVLDDRPDQARAALEAISATSRGTLTEMRRLLGVLRDGEGERSHAPAPCLADLPRLVEDVRAAGVPVTLSMSGPSDHANAGIELSAYRVVQEALTNVIKHAGEPTRVDVRVEQRAGGLEVEVVDDGRGAAALATTAPGGMRAGGSVPDGGPSGHGLVGMRERVELWGGALDAGPVAGGGYRVRARFPYEDAG